jgi:arylsulfatase A-like enzyme
MSSPKLSAVVFRSAILAGALVGSVDGLRAGVLAHLPTWGFFACFVLTVGFDVLVALALGLGLAGLFALAHWGRARSPRKLVSVLAWLLAGAAPVGAAVATITGTANRNNRFLAAGIVALATAVAALAASFVGPAFGRLLSYIPGCHRRSGDERVPGKPSAAGVLVLAPLVALACSVVVFFLVWRTRAPLHRSVLIERTTWVAVVSVLLPAALALASTRLARVRWWQAAASALLLFALPAGYLVRLRWTQDFQFMPWTKVVVSAGLLSVTAGLVPLVRRSKASGRVRWTLAAALPLASLFAVLVASASEPARKAASMHTGFAGDLLALGQRATDFDHDGYARWFGGGDCDDGDPERNPGARDWPDDGIDQDCDGKDASAEALRSPPFQAVPDSVPKDVKVLLVTIDTLRADHLGCYGYGRPTTPNLDRLAGEGTLFVNGWAHAPSTRYSMPAIATGRWPSAIEWDESIWWPRIAPSQPMIAQIMKGLGYTTAAFYAYSYFNRADQRGYERGVDYYDDSCAALHVNVNGPAESVGSSARQMADKGIAFLQAHGQEKFFLWMHFYDPHLNYARHPEAPNFGNTQADLYDGEIWFTDQQFGRVLDELRRLDLWDKTAIIVVGDHGESLGEHGIVAHGYHLYTPHTKVPFIIRVPGLSAQRLATPVGHVDLAPTMVNLARGPHQPSFLGRSLVDLLAGKPMPPPHGPVFQEVSYEGNVKRRAFVTATHHLIWNWTPDNTTECYDIARDPGELKDLWGLPAGEPDCSQLKEELRRRVALLSLPPGYAEKMAFGLAAHAGPPSHGLDVGIGSHLRVVGYDLSPQPIHRGESATLVTYFTVLGHIDPGWRLFFHLDGPGGFRNLDHVPVEGAYPIDRWRDGQHIRDRLHVAFTTAMPPGTYTVSVGLFKGRERAPISPAGAGDGQDRIRLATIQVQ